MLEFLCDIFPLLFLYSRQYTVFDLIKYATLIGEHPVFHPISKL